MSDFRKWRKDYSDRIKSEYARRRIMNCPRTYMKGCDKIDYSIENGNNELVFRKGSRIVATMPVENVQTLMVATGVDFEVAVHWLFDAWFGGKLRSKYPAFVEGLAVEL